MVCRAPPSRGAARVCVFAWSTPWHERHVAPPRALLSAPLRPRVEFLKPRCIFINHSETVISSDSRGMAKVPSAEDIVANVLITD